MTNNVLQVLRNAVAGVRPTGKAPGQIYVNFADGVFGFINAAGVAVDVASANIATNAVVKNPAGAQIITAAAGFANPALTTKAAASGDAASVLRVTNAA